MRHEVERLLRDDVQHFGLLPLDCLDDGPQAVIDPHEVARSVAGEPLGQGRGPLGGRSSIERQQSFAHLHLFVGVQLVERTDGTAVETVVVNVHHSPSGSPATKALTGRVCLRLWALYHGGNIIQVSLPLRSCLG